jgi:hypothetical protein
MEIFLALAGMGVAFIGVALCFHGFPSININKHYHVKEKNKKTCK